MILSNSKNNVRRNILEMEKHYQWVALDFLFKEISQSILHVLLLVLKPTVL